MVRAGAANDGGETQPKEWTVAVFMVVDDVLDPYALIDLREMQKAGSTAELDIVVQVNRLDDAAVRYKVDGHELVSHGHVSGDALASPVNPGDPKVLRHFLTWMTRHAPAKRYMLVLWGHFLGIGFGRFSNDMRHDPLTLIELGSELLDFVEHENDGAKIDILGCDTCRMSLAEASYELRDSVKHMVASEIGTELVGWPYRDVLTTIANRGPVPSLKIVKKRSSLESDEVGQAVVDLYVESFKPPAISFTLLNLEHASTLLAALQNLVVAVGSSTAPATAAVTHAEVKRAQVRTTSLIDVFTEAAPDEQLLLPGLIDLHDLCDELIRGDGSKQVRDAAAALREILSVDADGLLAHHRVTGTNRKEFHGMGIFAPVAAQTPRDWKIQRVSEEEYNKLQLVKSTGWGQLVYALFAARNAAQRTVHAV